LPFIAAGAALVGIIALTVKNYNKEAEAEKAAAEEAQHLSENYENLKNKAEELKNTISDYTESIKALEEMDSKTEEYGKTLDSVNKKAKQLIETYGLYDKYTITNGVITFDEGVLEGIQKEADDQASYAEQQMYSAKISANVMKTSNDATKVSRGSGVN